MALALAVGANDTTLVQVIDKFGSEGEPMTDRAVAVQTSPCPRCRSLNTKMYGIRHADGVIEVLTRKCWSCRKQWDFVAEFAPRRRKKPKESRHGTGI